MLFIYCVYLREGACAHVCMCLGTHVSQDHMWRSEDNLLESVGFAFIFNVWLLVLFYVCVFCLQIWLVLAEAKAGTEPWHWSYRWLWATKWDLNPGSLEEQPALLTTDPSLHPRSFTFHVNKMSVWGKNSAHKPKHMASAVNSVWLVKSRGRKNVKIRNTQKNKTDTQKQRL